MNVHSHTLSGCAPAPLANYLKALGVLRLVGEQADPHARGWWDGERFHLLTTLSREELEAFFLERYEPTPLLSPWNKGCGFFKPNDPGLAPLERSVAGRFERYRAGVRDARTLLNAVGDADAVIRAIKARTKTNRTFQTEEQRRLLIASEAYRTCLGELEQQLAKSDLPDEKRRELASARETIRTVAGPPTGVPTKKQVDELKESGGYKRLLASAERRFKALKATLIPDCRRLWRGPHADWLSAAVVLDEAGEPDWPSLLGTGGNDGRLDFTNNFMQQLGGLFDLASDAGGPAVAAKRLLANALWDVPADALSGAAVGQYLPGAAGGANSSTGFASGNLVNPWDFVLMMEGAVPFAARATRRLDPQAASLASAPFAVRAHAAGFATPGTEKAQRGEQWMPLWGQPATRADVAAMLGEARVQLDRRPANRPVDVARAIGQLGTARGIDAFVRYGYLERNGQSTLAVPLGRVAVRHRPRAFLIDGLAPWMDRLQWRSRDKNAPARLAQAERRLADAVFAALTHDHTPDRWQAILLAAVAVEAIQASGSGFEVNPIPLLEPEWVEAVDDDSSELRLALAFGGARAPRVKGQLPDTVRHHWLPLKPGATRFDTSEKRLARDPRVVMTGRDPIRDLIAVVERRLVEAARKGERRSRLVAAGGCGARPGDLAAFLAGTLDLDKLFGLARAFMALKWSKWKLEHAPKRTIPKGRPDEVWLALRMTCLPWMELASGVRIPAEPRVVRLLASDNAGRAVEIALARLRAAGIRPPLQAGLADAATARLWAAALAFPISQATANAIAETLDPQRKGEPRA